MMDAFLKKKNNHNNNNNNNNHNHHNNMHDSYNKQKKLRVGREKIPVPGYSTFRNKEKN